MALRNAFDALMPAGEATRAAHAGVLVVVLARQALPQDGQGVWSLLDAAECERVERKRRPQDRETTLLAYACHRLVLAAVLGCEPEAVPLFRDASGCPRLHADNLHTSLSHADPFIAIAVSARGPVGIDVEPVGRADGMAEIAGRICHASERASIDRLSPTQRGPALLALWVRKEALLKAAGVGLMHEMERFAAPAARTLALPGKDDGPDMEISMLDGVAGYVGAVASIAGLPVVRAVMA